MIKKEKQEIRHYDLRRPAAPTIARIECSRCKRMHSIGGIVGDERLCSLCLRGVK